MLLIPDGHALSHLTHLGVELERHARTERAPLLFGGNTMCSGLVPSSSEPSR